jgi:SWI/SNF-related matrix-associated actin-dependent regulator of chromatin subfamily A3
MINEWFQELEKLVISCYWTNHADRIRHFDRTTREALRTIKYHGPHRHVEAEILQEADIIVTTYHTLAADLNREKNTLKDMEWYRLVLDEG